MLSKSISRRQFLKLGSVAGGAFACGCSMKSQSAGSSGLNRARPVKQPNVLFFVVDDLRTQLGCYGDSEIISPNIDKISSQGIVFDRAYCQVPVCGASRASLLTGIRPDHSRGRFTTASSRADRDTPHAVTLPGHFKNKGYHTISNGKIFHFVNDKSDSWSEKPWRVYDYDTGGSGDWAKYYFDKIWMDPESANHLSSRGRGPYFEKANVSDDAYEDGKTAMKTISDLRRLKKQGKPFFLACGFSRPHLPFNAPEKYYDMYDRSRIKIAANRYAPKDKPPRCRNSGEIKSYSRIKGWPSEEAFHRQSRHAYYACVSYVDAMIGKILDELKAQGLDKDTIIVLWGDHGWHLGEHNFWGKHNTLNNALQAPLIISAPKLAGQRRTKELVEFVDVYPTLCELAGMDIPSSHSLDGRSLVPLMKKTDMPWKKAVFSEWQTGKAVKTDRYLYTEWTDGSRMLYDHQTDPDENINIAGNQENAAIVSELSALLGSGF